MDNLSIAGIAELYQTTTEIVGGHIKDMKAKPMQITQETNWLEHTIEVYDEETIVEIWKRIYGRDISEDYDLTEFNKMLKKWLKYNITER